MERFTIEDLDQISEDLVVGIYPPMDVLVRLLVEMRQMREELAQIDEVLGRFRT